MKNLRLGSLGLLAVGVLISSTGCSGVASSHSVSPASFLIPGLIRNDIQKPVVPASTSATNSFLVAVR